MRKNLFNPAIFADFLLLPSDSFLQHIGKPDLLVWNAFLNFSLFRILLCAMMLNHVSRFSYYNLQIDQIHTVVDQFPANATNAFPLRNLRTSPISAINFGANVFPTPPISLTTEYSGKVLAISCIRDKIRPRVASTSLSTRTASVTSILTDEVSEGNVGILS